MKSFNKADQPLSVKTETLKNIIHELITLHIVSRNLGGEESKNLFIEIDNRFNRLSGVYAIRAESLNAFIAGFNNIAKDATEDQSKINDVWWKLKDYLSIGKCSAFAHSVVLRDDIYCADASYDSLLKKWELAKKLTVN